MTETTFPVTIDFHSDWLIGTGYSRGKRVDQSVLLDDHDLPYVPAKTLVGLLRFRAQQVAEALDSGSTGIWHDWHTYVFGSEPSQVNRGHTRHSPTPAALFAAPLTMSGAFVAAREAGAFGEINASDVAKAATVVRAAVALDRDRVTARPDALRFIEHARGGVSLSARWSLGGADRDKLWPAILLLASAAKLITAVGGGRRRGAGEAAVSVGVDDDGLRSLLSRIDEEVPAPPERIITDTGTSDNTSGQGLAEYDITIKLLQPTIVDAAATANNVRSAAVIPGGTLLPVVLPSIAADRNAIRDSRISVSDATIEVAGRRGLPWPQSFGVDKTSASPQAQNVLRDHVSNPKNKPRSGFFVTPAESGFTAAAPELSQRLHAVVGDESQGPENLFSTNALPAGTVLRAVLSLADGASLRDGSGSSRPIRLGRSRKDDYGDAEITIKARSGGTQVRSGVEADVPFPVYLESDAVLIDSRGGYAPTAAQLIAELNSRLPDRPLRSVRASPDADSGTVRFAECVSVERIDGWQTRWGVPRPSVFALAAGSVVAVASSRPLSGDDLARIGATPVGLRTVEGKGRLLIADDWLRAESVSVTTPSGKPAAIVPEGSSADPALVHPLLVAAFQTKVDEHALRAAGNMSTRNRYLPAKMSNAQLGLLRGLIEGLGTEEGVAAFRRWRDKVKNSDSPWKESVTHLDSLIDGAVGAEAAIWRELFGDTPLVTDGAFLDDQRIFAVQTFLVHALRYRTDEEKPA